MDEREWWRGSVLYQIYPRSFCDTTGNGIGDLAGIAARLDYIAALGVKGIWISPFFKSPMNDFGYDVSDYCDVDPLFGTMEDFEELLSEAHRRGLKIIIDMVLSHSSDQHAWFIESRADRNNDKADWYVWADPKPDGSPPNNWLSIFGGGAWTWEPRRRQYYLHNFLGSQPDLNFHCPAVQEALLDACRFWLELGVDGFRLDVCNYYFHDPDLTDNPAKTNTLARRPPTNPYHLQHHIHDKSRPEVIGFLERLRSLTDMFEGRFLVGEIGDDQALDLMKSYTGGPGPLHTAYCFELLAEGMTVESLATAIKAAHSGPDTPWPSWSFSNHDVRRARTRWGGDQAPSELAICLNALLMALPGTVFLYQGEELGLPEADLAYEDLQDPVGIAFYPDTKGRDGCRTPMPWEESGPYAGFSEEQPWLPVPQEHVRASVATQIGKAHSLLSWTQKLIELRHTTLALQSGAFEFIEAPLGCLAILRHDIGAELLCIFNPTARSQTLSPALSIRVEPVLLMGRGIHWNKDSTISLEPFGFGFLSISSRESSVQKNESNG